MPPCTITSNKLNSQAEVNGTSPPVFWVCPQMMEIPKRCWVPLVEGHEVKLASLCSSRAALVAWNLCTLLNSSVSVTEG